MARIIMTADRPIVYNWSVNKSRPSQQKRQRERQRQERQKEKQARRQEIAAQKANNPGARRTASIPISKAFSRVRSRSRTGRPRPRPRPSSERRLVAAARPRCASRPCLAGHELGDRRREHVGIHRLRDVVLVAGDERSRPDPPGSRTPSPQSRAASRLRAPTDAADVAHQREAVGSGHPDVGDEHVGLEAVAAPEDVERRRPPNRPPARSRRSLPASPPAARARRSHRRQSGSRRL